MVRLAAYITVHALPFLVTGAVRELLGDTANRVLAFLATSWLVILFFIVTPYRIWADEKIRASSLWNQLRPKLRASYTDSDHACHKQIIEKSIHGKRNGVSIRIKVESDSSAPVHGCSGYLTAIEYRGNPTEQFTEIPLYEPNLLPWALDEFVPITIHPRVPRFLGICGTRDYKNTLSFRSKVHSLVVPNEFKEQGEYRFTIQIISRDTSTLTLCLCVTWNGRWNEVRAWQYEETLASRMSGETQVL